MRASRTSTVMWHSSRRVTRSPSHARRSTAPRQRRMLLPTMTRLASPGRLVGQSVLRVEDERILTGRGRYVDDVVLPRMLHAAFLRSGVPHARIRRVDAAAARALDDVVAVFTGAELVAELRLTAAPPD